jgi:hypothetical protein
LLGLMTGRKSLAETEQLTDELTPAVRSKLGIFRRVSDTTLRDDPGKSPTGDRSRHGYRRCHRPRVGRPSGVPCDALLDVRRGTVASAAGATAPVTDTSSSGGDRAWPPNFRSRLRARARRLLRCRGGGRPTNCCRRPRTCACAHARVGGWFERSRACAQCVRKEPHCGPRWWPRIVSEWGRTSRAGRAPCGSWR